MRNLKQIEQRMKRYKTKFGLKGETKPGDIMRAMASKMSTKEYEKVDKAIDKSKGLKHLSIPKKAAI